MFPSLSKTPLLTFTILVIFALVGCRGTPTPEPQAITPSPTRTPTPTVTLTPTPTETRTLAFTITPRPSYTPTITPTPLRTLSPTPSATTAPPRPAQLFGYEDVFGTTVDWSYAYVTEIGYSRLDEVNRLWAFMAFQLLDRGIHQRNFNFLGDTITIYYLNVAREFNGQVFPMQLVLGGTPGANVPISEIPAGGTAYLQVQVRDQTNPFSPQSIRREAHAAFAREDDHYPLIFIRDLQALLPDLPDEVILLAEHPILLPRDNWPQIKLDMRRVSYLAARHQPFFEIDAYDRLADQSPFAYALRDYLLDGETIPDGYYAFSSRTLIIVTGE